MQNNVYDCERANHNIIIRLSKSQHERLKFLAESSNYKTVSQYCRDRLLESPSIEVKINSILNLLKGKK